MMKFLTADDEAPALEILNRAVLAAVPDAELRSFTNAPAAVEEVCGKGYQPDAVFLDIRMPGMSGLQMAKLIKESNPRTNIIFVTAYADYAIDALEQHPSGYLLKPPTKEAIETELQNLRYPPQETDQKVLRVQCFGNFEVYAAGKPLKFEFSRTKEVFAYLVDRKGAAVNTGELCCALWDDTGSTRKVQLRKHIADLGHTLADAGAGAAFLKSRNSFAVAKDKIDCDYYRFLNGEIAAVNAYAGEYMMQYSWAEMTLGSLAQHVR